MFGTTEMLMVSSTCYDDPVEQHNKKSIGLPFPHVEVKLYNKFNSSLVYALLNAPWLSVIT